MNRPVYSVKCLLTICRLNPVDIKKCRPRSNTRIFNKPSLIQHWLEHSAPTGRSRSFIHTDTAHPKMAKTAPYGTWKSPITSILATSESVSFQGMEVDKAKGGVYWTEQRPSESGRQVVCSLKDDKSPQSWTPENINARTTVHEYGGGESIAHDGSVYFSDFENQRLFKQTAPGAEPLALTPAGKGWRYANGFFSQKTGKLYYVREDHGVVTDGKAKEAENTIVVLDPVTKDQSVLVCGADFYSSPKVSPDGSKIAWVQWIHPNMPWDTTEIWVAELAASGDSLVENTAKKVAAGDNNSNMYPEWNNENKLLYIGDQTEWWNLYLVEPSGEHVNLRCVEKEIGGPQWVFAQHAYDVDPSNSGLIATSYGGVLGVLNYRDKSYKALDTGYKSHTYVRFDTDGTICCVAAGPDMFSAVIRVKPDTGEVSVLKKSRELSTPIDPGYLSIPKAIDWKNEDGQIAYANYYVPNNKDFVAPPGELPPLLVKAHGGPTDESSMNLDLLKQYWTSRGFAILDVNYRGSTGHGKTFRHLLNGQWGIYDVEDCCNGALHLVNCKEVDESRLCIDGGSAGGYTTLSALTFKDRFNAGCSCYGIGDVEILMKETHKFESRYCDNLICPYTEENMPLIEARSPIKHLDNFNVPIVFFHGDEDKVVPPNQAELMFDAVKGKGIPCSFVLFKGEQHGFRIAENIQKSVDGEFYFYGKIFKFKPADDVGEIPIENLDE